MSLTKSLFRSIIEIEVGVKIQTRKGRTMRKISLLLFVMLFSFSYVWAQDVTPDLVGVYIWGPLNKDLNKAVDDVRDLGAKKITRTYIGPDPFFQGQKVDPTLTLAERLDLPEYQYMINGGFKEIILTAYDRVTVGGKYRTSFLTDSDLADVRYEFRTFSAKLCRISIAKNIRFKISGWEAENDVDRYSGRDPSDDSNWLNYRSYLQAQIDGVVQGRQEGQTDGSVCQVEVGFEGTRPPSYDWHLPSGFFRIESLLTNLDFSSYSSWASIPAVDDNSLLEKSIAYGIDELKAFQKQNSLPDELILGETGNNFSIHPDLERLPTILRAAHSKGVKVIVWGLYDDLKTVKDQHDRPDWNYGMKALDGTLNPQGEVLSSIFSRGYTVPREPKMVPVKQ